MARTRLGRYELLRLLGRGGMGEVYLARDPELDRPVALKLLSERLATESEFRERFLREARAVSVLSHPSITMLHEIGEADGRRYMAFEYVEGPTLEEHLAARGPLPLEEIVALGVPLAEALDYAHEKGVIHRDLKPANIVLSELGIPKILDFGLARILSLAPDTEAPTAARLTQAGVVVGTIAYMSPEQALGRAVDRRSDVFSLGAVLYEMATGRPPFEGGTATQLLDALLHGEPAPVELRRPELPAALGRIVATALRKTPEERYPRSGDLAVELARLARGGASAPRAASSRPEPPARADRRPSRRPLLAAVLLAVGIAVGAVLGTALRREPPPAAISTVALAYVENVADPDDGDRVASTLASLLAAELASLEGVHVVSPQRLYDAARAAGTAGGAIDRTVATEVATRAGVTTMVVGRIARPGGRLVATTELVDVATGRALASQAVEADGARDLARLARELGQKIRADVERLGGGGPPRAGLGAASAAAQRAFLEGERELVAGRLEEALERYEEATRTEPDFALAQFRRSMVARWLSDGVTAHAAARRAAALAHRLPPSLRPVARANAFYQEGDYAAAIPLLEAVLARDPFQKESLYLLSQIYFHSARDNDPRRAIDLMERLLALDPDFHQVYDRLALAYAFLGERTAARRWMERWASARPDKVEALRSVLATIEGQPEEALAFGQAFSWIEGPLFQASAAILASRWDLARRWVEIDPDAWRTEHLRAWGLRLQGVYHAYVGEMDRAVERLRAAGLASGLRVHEGVDGGVAASALQTLAELYELREELGAARAEAERALELQPESPRALYLAGRLAARDGDEEAAAAYHGRLAAVTTASSSPVGPLYRRALEAEIDLARGAAAAARASLEAVVGSGLLLADWGSTCSSAGASIREALAEAALAAGDAAAARRALEDLLASGWERLDHPVVYARALYRLGRLELEAGDVEAGRRHLERFLGLWSKADWEIAEVDEARRLLER